VSRLVDCGTATTAVTLFWGQSSRVSSDRKIGREEEVPDGNLGERGKWRKKPRRYSGRKVSNLKKSPQSQTPQCNTQFGGASPQNNRERPLGAGSALLRNSK